MLLKLSIITEIVIISISFKLPCHYSPCQKKRKRLLQNIIFDYRNFPGRIVKVVLYNIRFLLVASSGFWNVLPTFVMWEPLENVPVGCINVPPEH